MPAKQEAVEGVGVEAQQLEQLLPRVEQFADSLANQLFVPQLKKEEIEVRGGKIIVLHNPDGPGGIETKEYLDPNHMPCVTNFEEILLFPSLALSRNKAPTSQRDNVSEVRSDPSLLKEISEIAKRKVGYEDTPEGREERKRYLNAMTQAMKAILEQHPLEEGDVPIGIERCGGNIGRELELPGLKSIDAKRLRFEGDPDLLGAGVNIPEGFSLDGGNRLVFIEGIIASGSSIIAIVKTMIDKGYQFNEVVIDAVVAQPDGVAFILDSLEALGIKSRVNCAYCGGFQDKDWYVRYHDEDPLLSLLREDLLGEDTDKLVREQVIGDGGDLTSNVKKE